MRKDQELSDIRIEYKDNEYAKKKLIGFIVNYLIDSNILNKEVGPYDYKSKL